MPVFGKWLSMCVVACALALESPARVYVGGTLALSGSGRLKSGRDRTDFAHLCVEGSRKLLGLVHTLHGRWGKEGDGADLVGFLDPALPADCSTLFFTEPVDVLQDSLADCGLGVAGDQDSLKRASTKIEAALRRYRDYIATLFPESAGFVVSPAPHVTIKGSPGTARTILLDHMVVLTHRDAPAFGALLVDTYEGDIDGGYFVTEERLTWLLHPFIDNGPNYINESLARALAAQAQALDASWAPRFSMDFTVGADRSFVPMQRRYGPYLAAEMSYRLECGSRKAGAQLSVWKMRTRHSFVITGMAGVAARNRWAIYCPCSFVLTSARLSLQEASTEGCRDAGEHISKKQTGWESGLGVRLFVSKHFTFGLRGTLGTYSKIQLQRQGYTLALGDGKRRVVYRVGVEVLIPLG